MSGSTSASAAEAARVRRSGAATSAPNTCASTASIEPSMESVRPVAFAKDFLSILDLSAVDLDRLLAISAHMKSERRLGRPTLPHVLGGRHVALLFEKPSLRTRSTFEIAIRELGGDTLHLPAQFAEGVREPLADIARN